MSIINTYAFINMLSPSILKLHTEYTGAEFNKAYEGTKFYKFLNYNLIHYGVKYELGLNIDPIEFNPTNTCSKGGLYFSEKNKCHLHYRHYGFKLALIEIPNDARVYVEDSKFKADRLIIKNITNFFSNDALWIDLISKDGLLLEYINEQTPEICMKALKQNGLALEFVKEQTPEICMTAIKQNGSALQFVTEPFLTEEICILAVKNNGFVLQFIKKHPNLLTENVCKFAVQESGCALQFIKNQTYEICILAVQRDSCALCFVKEKYLTASNMLEICIIAVQQDGLMLNYVKDQTPEMCILAVKQNGFALQYVKEQTAELCILAVQQNGLALECVKEQTPEICILAVKQNKNAFKAIRHSLTLSESKYCIFDSKFHLIEG